MMVVNVLILDGVDMGDRSQNDYEVFALSLWERGREAGTNGGEEGIRRSSFGNIPKVGERGYLGGSVS